MSETTTKRTKLLTAKEVMEKTTLTRTTMWRYIRAGNFPAGLKLGPSRVAWREDEVDAWIESCQRVELQTRRLQQIPRRNRVLETEKDDFSDVIQRVQNGEIL